VAAARTLRLDGKTLEDLKSAAGLSHRVRLGALASALEQMTLRRLVRKLTSLRSKSRDERKRNAQRLWKELSAGALPKAPADRIALVRIWLSDTDKPTGGGSQRSVDQPNSPWPILQWLIGSDEETTMTLQFLQHQDPTLARQWVNDVMSLGKEVSRALEAPGNVIGKLSMHGQKEAALSVQQVADRLRIPIDDALRIGPLPYLER